MNIWEDGAREKIEGHLGGYHELVEGISRYILMGEEKPLPDGITWGDVARAFCVPEFVHAYALLMVAGVIK